MMKKIDMHVHCAPPGSRFASPDDIRPMYEQLGIDKGVLMTMGIKDPRFLLGDVIGWWFAPVGPLDAEEDFTPLLEEYIAKGASGVTEQTVSIPLDDPRYLALFRACARLKLPVTLHFRGPNSASYGVIDDLHLPRLEHVLEEIPDVRLIGHSPIFWNEISTDVTDENREGYLTTPLQGEGRVQALLRKYPNLHCDLSANSAFCALMRDEDYTCRFLEEFQDQVLYATDIATPDAMKQPFTRLSSWLDEMADSGRISRAAYEKICRGNALRLLNRA